ncbi:hypothetical protein [Streptomyces sp. CoH27]|uniref:hypothetical protein n=1 Tax=Streptomyces sp. CoH27 TaxID=2875763 RepID=UPI001CD7AAB0|nr:hypothetical protein [Streptomyces sp. CoH27]
MSVSLYYHASRAEPLTGVETAAIQRIVAARAASFPYADEEQLFLYSAEGIDPDEILAGSTRLPLDPDRLLPVITHVLGSLTQLRRTLDGEWHVHLEDVDLPWDESEGYVLPDTDDTGRAASEPTRTDGIQGEESA